MATDLRQLRAGGAPAGEGDIFQSLLQRSVQVFDPDAYHVMQQRDEQLIEDELMHGSASKAFVYDFDIKGTRVTGVSIVGARQLASEYGGIKSKIVATVEKRGALFIFRSFDPLNIHTSVLHELSEESDYYECVMQVDDIKTGNSTQVRKKETKTERKRDGGTFERPHYDVIAESKARRNGILDVLPQSVILAFKQKHLAAGNKSDEKTLDQLRTGAMQFSAKYGITLDRGVLQALTYAEIAGIGGAAALGVDAFKKACEAVGLVEAATGEIQPPAQHQPKAAAPRQQRADPPAPAPAKAQPQTTATAPAQAPAEPQQQASFSGELSPEEIARFEAEERASSAQTTDTKPAATPAAAPQRRTRAAMPDVP
jgi:hypothetical protein